MAKIEVSTRLIADAIFPEAGVRIVGARYDYASDNVIFEIEGPGVPLEFGLVTAIVTERRVSIEFKKVERREPDG